MREWHFVQHSQDSAVIQEHLTMCVLFSGIPQNTTFRMRAEWIPQGDGMNSTGRRNMSRLYYRIPKSVHTTDHLFLNRYTH